jgi:LPXTG-site transpeptidase (sortase) family protein
MTMRGGRPGTAAAIVPPEGSAPSNLEDVAVAEGEPRGRGGRPWGLVLALLGCALVGASLPSVVPGLFDTDSAEKVRSKVQAPAQAPAQARARTLPFVVEPGVNIEAAEPEPHPAAGRPDRLVVPKLGIDAPVIGIGVVDGTLLPPSDPQTLGWWSAGAAPGALRGGALITGHTVHSGGGAFDNLETLQAGDRVRVRTAEGVIPYVVRGVTVYRKATLARDAERVFSQTVPGRLVLITCEDWNGTGYDSNAIVFAERPS